MTKDELDEMTKFLIELDEPLPEMLWIAEKDLALIRASLFQWKEPAQK